MSSKSNYTLSSDGIFRPSMPVKHREEEYEEDGFETLRDMQDRHFWYRGRHRFLLAAVDRFLPKSGAPRSAIDLGGGAGGWVSYLAKQRPERFNPLALADSSIVALTLAESVFPPAAQRYQVDLMQLQMRDQWDAAFLLDVIEHIPDDLHALEQAREALKPGGYLFVATPAFPQFWSYNDDLAQHQRRYVRSDFMRLAQQAELTLCDARYFMFYLSPLYLISRMKPGLGAMTDEQKKELVIQQHRVPSVPINTILTTIFTAETPLGHWLRFPWGTSILGVFRKNSVRVRPASK